MSHSQIEFFKVFAASLCFWSVFNFTLLSIIFKIEDFLEYRPLLRVWIVKAFPAIVSIVSIVVLCFNFK